MAKKKKEPKDTRPYTLISYEKYLNYSTALQEEDFQWENAETSPSEFHENLCLLSDHWQMTQRFADKQFQMEIGMAEEPVIVAARRWPSAYELYEATEWEEKFYNIDEIIERIGVCQSHIRGLYCAMTVMLSFDNIEKQHIGKNQTLCKDTLSGKDGEASLYNSVMAIIYKAYWTPGSPQWQQTPKIIGHDADGRGLYRQYYKTLQYRYMRESYRKLRRGIE